MHLIGPGHFGSLSQNHRREFEFLLLENVSEKTQEEERRRRRRRHCIIQTESVRGRGGCGSFYMELSHWCPRAAAGVAGIHRTCLSSSLELRLIFKRTPPLLFHLLRCERASGATRRDGRDSLVIIGAFAWPQNADSDRAADVRSFTTTVVCMQCIMLS